MQRRQKCPKCQSTMTEQTRDEHGEYGHCIMCGYVFEEIDLKILLEVSGSMVDSNNPNTRMRGPHLA